MPSSVALAVTRRLNDARAASLWRERVVHDSPTGPIVQIGGTKYLAFCSNDYLGLANHPEVVAALIKGAQTYGVGSGASHLVVGHSRPHHLLEEELAAFVGRSRALLFSSGYMANLAVAGALLTRHDWIFEDRLNHASLLDAAILSRGHLRRFGHKDLGDLRARLEQADSDHKKLISTDGVFSMDGDVAPLTDLVRVAKDANGWLAVDDAHGVGVLGDTGAGCVAAAALSQEQVPILVGTLGKAFGTFGAFVAGEDALIETLIQTARPYIYTTALPPAIAEATRAALNIVIAETWRREHLAALVARFRDGAEQLGLPLADSLTPIQPIVLGDAAAVLQASKHLKSRGLQVTAIRPPTVPAGTARLRITLSAAHSETQVDQLLDALATMVSTNGVGATGHG